MKSATIMNMNHINEIIVNNIRRICKSKNIMISQMEEELGFSPGLISRWSRTKTSPSFDKVAAVMEYLGITYEELTGETKITSVNFLSDAPKKTLSPSLNSFDILLKNTIDRHLTWQRTGDKLPLEISSMNNIFTNWYLYDIHKYYFTTVVESLVLLIIEYNTRTCHIYEALYLIHHQMDGSITTILEQDRRLLDLLKYIDNNDYENICNHYKNNFLQSYENSHFTNETKFKGL